MKKVKSLAFSFGAVVAEERKKLGMSQEQLAEAIGATNVYISLLETGQRQPSLNASILIAESFGMKPEELISKICCYISTNG